MAKDRKETYDEWFARIPENKRNTENYDLKRAYEVAPQEDLEKFASDENAHLMSAYQLDDGSYEFMKMPNHPTIDEELKSTFNNPEFRNQYALDTSGAKYRYVPKANYNGVDSFNNIDWQLKYENGRDNYAERMEGMPEGADKVLTRTIKPTSVKMPQVNVGSDANPVMASPTESKQPILTPEEKAQKELVERGASYVGKDLATLMKENPTMRPTDFMKAMDAYNVANGKEKYGWEDAAAFYGDRDPYKSRNEVKKDRRRMLWADGINELANVLQSVVNYANGTDVKVHDAEKTRERNAQLRRYMDEQRVARLNNLMTNIKAENDARRAAAAEQLKYKHQMDMERLKWDNPKVKADIAEIESKINLNNIKSAIDAQNLIIKELEAKNYDRKTAAEIAKIWADVAKNNQETKNKKLDYENNVVENYRNQSGRMTGLDRDEKNAKIPEVITGEEAAEIARRRLGLN